MIEMQHVKKTYGKNLVIKDGQLVINQQEQCALVGASGSGKSTLLYMMGGLERPDEGKIFVNQQELTKMSEDQLAQMRNETIGFVFQFHFLLPTLTCFKNILLPLKIANRNTSEHEKTILDYAKFLSVEHCMEAYPFQLSGGEQQRVNLIRAIIMRPKLLLCDEPTGNLDSVNSKKVIELLRGLAQDFHATLLVVTHDEKIANSFRRKLSIEDGHLIG
jgi:ABC-type lipoprotein export system ATPase subunit